MSFNAWTIEYIISNERDKTSHMQEHIVSPDKASAIDAIERLNAEIARTTLLINDTRNDGGVYIQRRETNGTTHTIHGTALMLADA